MNDVARNLKRIRERRGISQETVAVQLHTTRQTISNWERGQNNPSIDDLMRLAEFFQVGIDELIYPDRESRQHFLGPNPGGTVFGVLMGAAASYLALRVLFDRWEPLELAVVVMGLVMLGCTRQIVLEIRRR